MDAEVSTSGRGDAQGDPEGIRRVGVDGCRGGWVAVIQQQNRPLEVERFRGFGDLLKAMTGDSLVAVDMPIGLPDSAVPGGRDCDRAARQRLGKRSSSVFSPPVRAALDASSFERARAIQRASSDSGLSLTIQGFHLLPKIREIDGLMTPGLQDRVFEAHPEAAFAQLNDGRPMEHPKRTRAGRRERRALLARAGYSTITDRLAEHTGWRERHGQRTHAAADDLLDACVLCWTAGRIARGEALRLPDDPPEDERGLLMEIWA